MLFPVLGNIYSKRRIRLWEVIIFAWSGRMLLDFFNIIARKAWMQPVFNRRIQTAEPRYWVYRLDVFWPWIKVVQWWKLLFVMPVPPNICKWVQMHSECKGMDSVPALSPWETRAAGGTATALQLPTKQNLPRPDISEPLMAYSSFSGWVSLQHWGTDLCMCCVSQNQTQLWSEQIN